MCFIYPSSFELISQLTAVFSTDLYNLKYKQLLFSIAPSWLFLLITLLSLLFITSWFYNSNNNNDDDDCWLLLLQRNGGLRYRIIVKLFVFVKVSVGRLCLFIIFDGETTGLLLQSNDETVFNPKSASAASPCYTVGQARVELSILRLLFCCSYWTQHRIRQM